MSDSGDHIKNKVKQHDSPEGNREHKQRAVHPSDNHGHLLLADKG